MTIIDLVVLMTRAQPRRFVVASLVAAMGIAGYGCGGDAERYERLIAEGDALRAGGQAGPALERFLLAQKASPERKDAYIRIGGICESERIPRRGIPVLREAVARNDENRATYRFLLAVLAEIADERFEAEASYRDCIRLDPSFAPAYGNLAQFLFTAGRHREALELMAEATERFAGNRRLELQYAEILMRTGSLDDAERRTRALLEGPDPLSEGHYLMGLIDLQHGRPDEARHRLETATRLEPDNLHAWYQLANASDRIADSAGRQRALERFEALYRRALDGGTAP